MANVKASEITRILRQKIEGFEAGVDISEEGTIISVGDGIARIYGLDKVMYGELIELPSRRRRVVEARVGRRRRNLRCGG